MRSVRRVPGPHAARRTQPRAIASESTAAARSPETPSRLAWTRTTASRALQSPCYACHSSPVGRQIVTPGIDRLLTVDRRLIAGRRVGLVCNPASVDASLAHTADRLLEDPDVTLAALFGPQHGFRSDLQDNMIETPHGGDCRRRVPVFSLYSDTREPTAEMLEGLDVLVVDLQDVGTRVYTYIYTMANCMRAAARHGLPVVVCDRPNPIGGDAVEGARLRRSRGARLSDSSPSRCGTA